MADPRLSFVFLTYNRLGITARCLSSLAPTLRRDDVEWIILDNASVDGTTQWLQKLAAQYPGKVRLNLQARNAGVAGGREILFDMARGDVIISMDSDVEARRAGWLDKLLEPLSRDDVWLCGPGGVVVIDEWTNFAALDPAKPQYADACAGYCQVISRKAIDAGVRLDQAYNPRWHEDSDYCMQVQHAGGKVWHTGDVGLFHVFAMTGDDGSSGGKLWYFRNKWRGKGLIRAEMAVQHD
jgi:glycosyltransferase involved in cell wall biosynthesis